MPSNTTIRVTDDQGAFLFETAQFLEIGDSPGLRYVLSCGLVGALTVTLPPEFNAFLLGANNKPRKDLRIHVMRSVNGAPAQREGGSCFLTRAWKITNDYTAVTALHVNHLMWRRCNLYAYGDGSYSVQGLANEMIRDLFDFNNFTTGGITTARQGGTTQFDLASFISIDQDDYSVSITAKVSAWMIIGDVIREICDDSTFAGNYLTAEVIAPTESTLAFKIYLSQRGADRRFSGGNGLLFSESRGNLADAILTVDATEEKTLALAGGPQRDWGGTIQYAQDTARMGESVFGRIETFVDSQATDNTSLLNDATAAVRAGRPVTFATAEIQETDQCLRGVDFDYGDLVTVEVLGIQYDMHLDVLEVTLQGGVETTKASFYADG